MPVIGFEGLDGVGKTTLAEAFARHAGGVALTSMPEVEGAQPARAEVNAGDDPDVRFEHFLAFNAQQMEWARDVAADGTFVTLDSSVFRTFATHRVLGSQRALVASIPSHLMPDASFLLELKKEARLKRLMSRDGGLVHSSHSDETLFERSPEVNLEYLRQPELIRINTKNPTDELLPRLMRRLAL